MYRVFRHPRHRVLSLLGLPVPAGSYEECWALRGMTLVVPRGERLGVIGSNGAGKSTLLKLIAGQLPPTTGTVEVAGTVQPLMELGTGFHPEFTGRENVFAALGLRGISGARAREAFEEILDFAELEDAIDRPIGTYSSGMYTRLAFSVATSIEPDTLVIDEVLSAGDAYFSAKCVERMRELTTKNDTTVVFVSHDLHAVQSLCTRAIWLEKGVVVEDGDPLQLARAYYKATQERENQRLRLRARSETREIVRRADDLHEVSPNSIVTWKPVDPRIDDVRILNADGEQAGGVAEGESLIVEVRYTAVEPVEHPVFGMSIYRPDSLPVCRAVSSLGGLDIPLLSGSGSIRFCFSPFYGGAGEYVVSASIFKHLALGTLGQSEVYDAHDRSYRFRVWGDLDVAVDMGVLRNPYDVEHVIHGALLEPRSRR